MVPLWKMSQLRLYSAALLQQEISLLAGAGETAAKCSAGHSSCHKVLLWWKTELHSLMVQHHSWHPRKYSLIAANGRTEGLHSERTWEVRWMLHETISCNLLVDVAEMRQGQRSTDTTPKSGDDPKGCISNPLIANLSQDLKDVSIHKGVPSFLPRNTFTFLICPVQIRQYYVKNMPIHSCAAGKGETLPAACSPCTISSTHFTTITLWKALRKP